MSNCTFRICVTEYNPFAMEPLESSRNALYSRQKPLESSRNALHTSQKPLESRQFPVKNFHIKKPPNHIRSGVR